MDDRKRMERQAQLQRIDAYLEKLYQEHRIRFDLIAFGVAVLVCSFAWLMAWLVDRLFHWIVG